MPLLSAVPWWWWGRRRFLVRRSRRCFGRHAQAHRPLASLRGTKRNDAPLLVQYPATAVRLQRCPDRTRTPTQPEPATGNDEPPLCGTSRSLLASTDGTRNTNGSSWPSSNNAPPAKSNPKIISQQAETCLLTESRREQRNAILPRLARVLSWRLSSSGTFRMCGEDQHKHAIRMSTAGEYLGVFANSMVASWIAS